MLDRGREDFSSGVQTTIILVQKDGCVFSIRCVLEFRSDAFVYWVGSERGRPLGCVFILVDI